MFMVDYELFKSILENKKTGYIEKGDYINTELIDLFVKHGAGNIKALFKQDGETSYYFVDVKCKTCGKIFKQTLSKSKLFNYINDIRQERNRFLCDDCEYEKKKREKQEAQQIEERCENLKENNTQFFIENYLNPDCTWKEGVSPAQKRYEMYNAYCDWDKIKEYICDMDYSDFLQTPYWKAIAESVRKYHNYTCQICNGTEGLSVHHKTYDHHGDELHHMKDLVCLCKDCHEKFHEVGKYA